MKRNLLRPRFEAVITQERARLGPAKHPQARAYPRLARISRAQPKRYTPSHESLGNDLAKCSVGAPLLTTASPSKRITTQGNHRFAIVLEEHVLRNPVGDIETMTAQLGHLLVTSTLPAISLGIIPTGADRTQTRPVEGFWSFDDHQAAVELVSGYLTITQPHELSMYTQAFAELSALAAFGVAARSLIRNALAAIEE